jgi:hypothetical protein
MTAGVAAALAVGFVTDARAESIIKNPGDHPDYSVELEPHLVLALGDAPGSPYWVDDAGFGLGFRASIPFLDGPIETINNSMAITFGFDWAHYGDDNACWRGRYWDDWRVYYDDEDCSANAFWFPVALQWNFWLTDIISVYGEPGLAIRHWRYNGPCYYWDPRGDFRICDYDNTDVIPVFYGGARFMFSDTVGLTTRLGFYPTMLNVGASFLL